MLEACNKFCGIFSKFLVLWVFLAVITGYFLPGTLTPLKDWSDWLFAVTMFGIGMVLSPEDFKSIISSPRKVLLGTLAQFAIMPLLAFVIARTMKLPDQIALGLIVAGAVPDAMAAGVISYLAGANVALSVSLTTSTTLISPAFTPTLTYIFGRVFIPVHFWPIFLSIVKMVILPLILGLMVKARFGKNIKRIINLFPAMSALFIAFICGLVVALNRDSLLAIGPSVFIAVFLLNLFGLILGYGAGRLFGFATDECRTLSIGVGMQNAGLGAVIAIKHFSAEAALPNVLFATWCIVTASILARYWSKKTQTQTSN